MTVLDQARDANCPAFICWVKLDLCCYHFRRVWNDLRNEVESTWGMSISKLYVSCHIYCIISYDTTCMIYQEMLLPFVMENNTSTTLRIAHMPSISSQELDQNILAKRWITWESQTKGTALCLEIHSWNNKLHDIYILKLEVKKPWRKTNWMGQTRRALWYDH